MEFYKLMVLVGYFVGYAFSVGAFLKMWESSYVEGFWICMVCLFWPIVWLFYLPYKLASWIFK